MRLLCSLVLGRQCRRSAEYPVVLSNRTTARTVQRTQLLTQNLHPRQPTPRIVSYSITRSIGGTQIPIARDEPPRLPSRGFLVWGFVKEEFQQATRRRIFFPSSVFFVRSESPFLRPDPHFAHAGARRSCQGWPSHQPSACFAFARPYLDSFEHDGTLGAIEMTIRGEPAFGRGSIAPQPCIRWVQEPEP